MRCSKSCTFIAMCRVTGCRNLPFDVRLYNANRVLIARKRTDPSGNVRFSVPYPGLYTVYVNNYRLSPRGVSTRINLYAGRCSYKYFIFNVIKSQPPKVQVTFTLRDAKYSGFPIKQGVISIWLK